MGGVTVGGLVDVVTSPERAAAYRAAGWWDDATLAGQVRAHASERPDAIAVVDEAGAWTYAQLAADAALVAASLRATGVGEGAVVSVQLPNRYPAAVAAVAVQGLGGVINPLLPSYRARELTHVFRTARPAVIVTPRTYRGFDHVAMLAAVVAETGVAPRHVVVDVVSDDPDAGIDADDGTTPWEALTSGPAAELPTGRAELVSELIFTSGTEATPKAVMHTEQTTGFSVRVARDDLGITDADVVWMPSPVGHSTGFNYGLRFALHHGLRLVLQDRWDADVALELVTREGCTYTLAATTFLQDLCGAAARAGVRLDSLRTFGCGGAPVPPPLVDRAGEQGITVLRLYGSTEVLVATWNRGSDDAELRRSTDGRGMSHVEVEVRRDDGTRVDVGEPGEIFVRGPDTCVGFFDDADRTAATFTDGWVRSGDLATLDGAGHLTVVGRRKEIIIRGGINIAPREIEELLVAFPEVERAAVVGVPDDRLGERMCACVVLAPDASLAFADVVARLEGQGLARFKLPEQLVVLDALPTTASGKVQKHEIVRTLVEAAATGAADEGSSE
jgi:acyl-CoA synthetase (AMP-forming)/AMP-acid ligase II